jgi:small-conductance mechanosensitive channel
MHRSLAIALLSVLLGCSAAFAAQVEGTTAPPATLAAQAPVSTHPPATLQLLNRSIFQFRSELLGTPPQERADNARPRIVALLERGGPGLVTVESIPQGAAIKIDGSLAFVVAQTDADLTAGETPELLAEKAAERLRQVIAESREARDARHMLEAAIAASIATLVYLVLLWLVTRLTRPLFRRILSLAHAQARRVTIGDEEVVHSAWITGLARGALRGVYWTLVLLLTYEWLGFVLVRFPYTRAWGEQLQGFLVGIAVGVLSAFVGALPGLVVVLVIAVIARSLDAISQSFFDRVKAGRIALAWIEPDTATPTRRLATTAIWLFALAMAYPYFPGSGTEAFKGLTVLVGLMVSVGASGIVAQAAAGLILLYSRTYRLGEYVRVADQEGTIVALGTFTTRLRTGLGEELTLPNSLVLGSVVKNYSRTVKGPGFVVDTSVTIGYDTPWRQVHALLVGAALRTGGVLRDPAPVVFQTALSDFYVEYRLVCQATATDPRPRALVMSDLHAAIQDEFNTHGVQIMSPHYLGDPAQPKVVPEGLWHQPPARPKD